MLIGFAVSASIARARGYSALLYGGAGLVLNLGSIPMTLLLTDMPSSLDQSQEFGLTAIEPTQSSSPQLGAWMAYYQGFRQTMLLASLSGFALMVLCLFGFVVQIMPQFVMLYEGMSLALPAPTQVAIGICRAFRSEAVQWAMWFLGLVGPRFCCRFLLTSYQFPLFGKVWRHADQIWLLLAEERQLPGEVSRRLWGVARNECGLDCERDYLQGALWTASLVFVPILACFTLMLTFLLLCLLLPLSGGFVGNIGG